jgi:hypothetical protein
MLSEDKGKISAVSAAIRSLGMLSPALKAFVGPEEHQKLVHMLLDETTALYKR